MESRPCKDQGNAVQAERRARYWKADQVEGAEMFRMAGEKRRRGMTQDWNEWQG